MISINKKFQDTVSYITTQRSYKYVSIPYQFSYKNLFK